MTVATSINDGFIQMPPYVKRTYYVRTTLKLQLLHTAAGIDLRNTDVIK